MEKSAQAFRTISEVAQDLDLPQHVLRFWETRFVQIKPLKRGGGRRYYRPEDVDLLRAIRRLLYGEGYTIKGVQKILKEQGPRLVAASHGGDGPAPADPDAPRLRQYEDADDDLAGGSDVLDGAEAAVNFASNQPQRQAPAARDREAWDANRIHAFQDHVPRPMPATENPRGQPGSAPGNGALAPADRGALQELLAELVECARILDAARGG